MRFIAIWWLCCAPCFVLAAEFRGLGTSSMFSNDYFGDGEDRWRTGSYSLSTFYGNDWNGDMPAEGLIEFRFRGEVIAPTDASQHPTPGERPFVGVTGIGGARHFMLGRAQARLGGEFTFIGPQTGVSSLVTEAHDMLGFKVPHAATGQLDDDVIPTASFALARQHKPTQTRPFEIRSFMSAQAGVETFARIGFDAFFGAGTNRSMMARDVVTGQMLSVVVMDRETGLAPTLGMDITHVWDSRYLPSSSGLTAKKWRMRVRGGLRNYGRNRDLFFGMTWLSPEYEGQPGGQVVGSISIDHHY